MTVALSATSTIRQNFWGQIMREIKFRGLDQYDKWRYGDLTHVSCNGRGILFIADNKQHTYVKVRTETVGQYTGLRDAEGHEIYEGDIVKTYNGSISVVIWDDATHGWREMANGIKCRFAPGELAKAYTVVGNIHDNPELLEAAYDQGD